MGQRPTRDLRAAKCTSRTPQEQVARSAYKAMRRLELVTHLGRTILKTTFTDSIEISPYLKLWSNLPKAKKECLSASARAAKR